MVYEIVLVCILVFYVKKVVEYVLGKLVICIVIGFLNGYSIIVVKVFEC